MKIKIKTLLLFVLLVSSVQVLNAQKMSGFTFYKEVEPVNTAGYYKIPVSADMLAKSKSDFNDFRVLKVDENDTSEVPYLLQWNESSWYNTFQNESIIDVSYRKNAASYITVKLKEEKEINEIQLNIAERDFDKLVTIEGSNDNKHWKTIKENIRIVGFGQEQFNFSKLYFPSSTYTYYLLTFNDKNAKPITVSSVQTFFNNEYKAVYEKIKDIYVVKKEIKKDLKPTNGKPAIYENYTEIKVTLPYPTCLSTIHLKNRNKSEDFYRSISVCNNKGAELSRGSFTSLEKDGITSIYLNKVIGTNFTIKVYNNDNPPIESIDVNVFGMNAFLVSRLEPEEKYLIVYGKAKVPLAEYDLGYFSSKIGSTAKDVNCRSEMVIKNAPPKKNEPMIQQQKWLWITLGGLVLLLGGFAFSLMKKIGK
ncbi:MAG: discoidin domain-containing protein [Bacteroidota bacterium]|nr:discoidin domain-containing protein [Bacteroidota bacterium]